MKKRLFWLWISLIVLTSCQDHDIAPQLKKKNSVEGIALSFKEFVSVPMIQELNPQDMERIVSEQPLTTGKVIFYTLHKDNEALYGAYELAGKLYGFGDIGGQLNTKSTTSEEMTLWGLPLVKVTGVYGANAPVAVYLQVDEEDVTPLLRVDTGNASELDLDHDGTEEILSTFCCTMQTMIYRKQGDGFSYVDVNEVLGAPYVYVGEDGILQVQYSEEDAIKRMAYREEMLYPLE